MLRIEDPTRQEAIVPNCHVCGEQLDAKGTVFGCHTHCYDNLQDEHLEDDDYQLQMIIEMQEIEDRHAAEDRIEDLIDSMERFF